MNYLRKLLISLCLIGYVLTIQAQNIITTTGGNVTGSSGSISYTIGQVFYNTFTGTNGTAAQGVQQPYEISIVTEIKNTEGIILEYKVYPNPTRGLITLTIKPFDNENFRFRLFDLNGILLHDKKIESEETEISLENFSSAIYLLKVIKENEEVKIFKIIKR